MSPRVGHLLVPISLIGAVALVKSMPPHDPPCETALPVHAPFRLAAPKHASDRSGQTWPVEPRKANQAEREVVQELNRVRLNPARYAERYLEPRKTMYDGDVLRLPGRRGIATEEGLEALEECIEELEKAESVPLLVLSEGLSRAARDHVTDQARSGETGHEGSDGSSFIERMERYGGWQRTAAENISYGFADPREIVIQLLVDDGVESRGHRMNILHRDFRLVGVAIGYHEEYRFMCVMDFAGGFTEQPDRR